MVQSQGCFKAPATRRLFLVRRGHGAKKRPRPKTTTTRFFKDIIHLAECQAFFAAYAKRSGAKKPFPEHLAIKLSDNRRIFRMNRHIPATQSTVAHKNPWVNALPRSFIVQYPGAKGTLILNAKGLSYESQDHAWHILEMPDTGYSELLS